MICDEDCFNCKYPDCIMSTYAEKREQFKAYYQKNKDI